jgi:integrase
MLNCYHLGKQKLQPTIGKKADKGPKMEPVKDELHFENNLAFWRGVWYYRFSVKNKISGKKKVYFGSTGFSKKSDAKVRLRELKDDANRDSIVMKPIQVPTFKEAIGLWYTSRQGKKSDMYLNTAKRQLEIHVVPKLGNVRCDVLNFDIVEVVLNDYLHGNNKQYPTKKHNLGGYNTLASWISAVLGNLVPTYMEVAPKIKLEKVQRRRKPFIPRDKADAFLGEIDRTENLHVSVAVRAMLYMGLRESEALQMLWENIDWDENTYCPGGMVGSEGTGTKGKEDGLLTFGTDMKVWLTKAKVENDAREKKSVWVLPSDDGTPHRKQFTKKAIVRAGTVIGAKLSPHRLRGTYATLLAKSTKGNSFIVKNNLRHKDIRTSEGYVDLGLEDMRKANLDLWEPVQIA